MGKIVVVTAPTGNPVSVSDAKAQCALTDSTHDTLLLGFIKAATASVEQDTGMRLMEQTLRIEYPGWPGLLVDLATYPVSAVTAVAYDDSAGDAQTLVEDTDYFTDLSGMYPKICAVTVWPATEARNPVPVRITVTAGYSADYEVPEDIRHAILVKVKEMYAQRGESVTGATVTPTVQTVKSLTDTRRRMPV